jgi:hypothetical protein
MTSVHTCNGLHATKPPSLMPAIEEFNARLASGRTAWFWPTISAALITKHHWLVIACDSCQTITEMDLTMKPRDPEAPIRVALDEARCIRCNGHGRKRILRLARFCSSFR